MGYVNFIQYNLPFTQQQDEIIRELGLTYWQGLSNSLNFPNLENNSILISHLGFWAAEDCKITIQGYEYENDEWVIHTREIQMEQEIKLNLKKFIYIALEYLEMMEMLIAENIGEIMQN